MVSDCASSKCYGANAMAMKKAAACSLSNGKSQASNSKKIHKAEREKLKRDHLNDLFQELSRDLDMTSKMVGIALNNSCRNTLVQLTNDFTDSKPEKLGHVLEAHVHNAEAFRCCAHGWTSTHDKLLLMGHKHFLPTHHDGSGKFLLPSGWKKIQAKFKVFDQHIVGLGDLQSRFYAIKRGVTELPKIVLYRLWSETENTVLTSLYDEIMSAERPPPKKIFLDPADYNDIQQSLWYYLKCCPEMEQIERRLLKIVHGKTERNA